MQTLDIECPSCGEMLELDAGFAGGVCRCSSCGTLMTVPSDAGKAESLMRPITSGSMSAGEMSSVEAPAPSPRRSSTSAKRGKKKKGKSGKRKRAGSSTVEAGEYRTASGKVVRVEKTTRVPMAESKKKQIRVVTGAIFFSIVLAVVVAAVFVILAIVDSGGGPGGGGRNGVATYNAAANPYTLSFANVMGLPVTGEVAVLIEVSPYSEEWMPPVGDMLAAGLGEAGSGDASIALIGAGAEPVNFAGGGVKALPLSAGGLSSWLGELPLDAEPNLDAGIKAALALEPDTLIVILGGASSADVQRWDELVQGQEALQVHVVYIGNSSPELEGWMSERDGEAVILSIDQIEWLKNDATNEEN